MSATRRFLLLLCVMVALSQGCVAPGTTGGLQPTGGEGAAVEVAIYAAAGALWLGSMATCGVADLLSLPFAAAGYLDYFFCSRHFLDFCQHCL